MHCRISYIEAVEKKKQVFLQSFNLSKCIVVRLWMVEELFSLLFYCESCITENFNRCYWGESVIAGDQLL